MSVLLLTLLLMPHPLEQKGIEHLYNLEFQAASEAFERLASAQPASPAGPHYLVLTLWMEELARRGAMAGDTFLSSRYWTRTRREPLSPTLLSRFQALVREAKQRSESLVESQDDAREALYFRGATESVVSAFEATLRHSYFASYRAARRAKEYHERLLKLDPSYEDAYLVPGIYEYTLASLPRSVKVFMILMGVRGSKEKGLELIRRSAKEGKRTAWGAKLLLSVIETREERYDQALKNLKELESAFPKNPLFPLERGWVQLLKKDWVSARSTFERVQDLRRQAVPHYDKVPFSLVSLRLGESFLFDSRFEDALERLDAALAAPASSDTIQAMVHLRRGQALDGLHRREEARAEYRLTVRLNTDKSSHRLASRYLEKPFELN